MEAASTTCPGSIHEPIIFAVVFNHWNESHFSNPEFDKLAKTAGTTLDEQERIQAYHDIQKLLIDQGPIIVPYFFAQFGAISNQFDGLKLKDFAGRTDFRTITAKGTP